MSETIEQKCVAKGVKLTDQRKVIAQVMRPVDWLWEDMTSPLMQLQTHVNI